MSLPAIRLWIKSTFFCFRDVHVLHSKFMKRIHHIAKVEKISVLGDSKIYAYFYCNTSLKI